MRLLSRSIIVLASVLVLASCTRRAETSAAAGADFTVDRLFTHEGCTVYRFNDAGNHRYYANCGGSASTNWTESCGKNCTRNHMVPSN